MWVSLLQNWSANTHTTDTYTQYEIHQMPPIEPQNPAAATFGDQLQFLGHDLVSGESDELVTYWRVAAPITQPMRLFVQVLDENGDIIAEDYSWDTADPQNLWQPHWQEGDLILQRHPLPENLADAAQLHISIFDPYSCEPGPCQNLITGNGQPFLLLPVQE